jgi:hypothetical protein
MQPESAFVSSGNSRHFIGVFRMMNLPLTVPSLVRLSAATHLGGTL